MNKAAKTTLILIILIVAVGAVIFGAVKLAGGLGDSGKVATKCDAGQQQKREFDIKNDSFSPAYVKAQRCDTITIKNLDNRGRLIAFGKHDHHIHYDGISERYLLKDESFTVTLNQTGTFLIHDHNQDEVQAEFTVQ